MYGKVTAYTAYSGSLTVDITTTQGSGAFNSWTINLIGLQGNNGANGTKYNTASGSGVSLDLGLKTWTVERDLQYVIGQTLIVKWNPFTSNNYAVGKITAYDPSNGSLTLNITYLTATTTNSSWNFNLSGDIGPQGVQGPTGPIGATGPQGQAGQSAQPTVAGVVYGRVDSVSNSAIGYSALQNNNNSDNTAIGHNALRANTNGDSNNAIGSQTLVKQYKR